MQRYNLIDIIMSFFSKDESIIFTKFTDPLGNFEIFYPKKWKFDRDIAVVDGRYGVTFESGDHHFTVSVDASIPKKFDFRKYAKKELESPESGIIASIKERAFRGMDAYEREYCFTSGRKDFFGGGLMFFTGNAVFSLSWSAPEKEREKMEAVFKHMLEKLTIYSGFSIRK